MTITRIYDDIVFQCDGDHCHESLETGESDFNAAQTVRKQEGWHSVKDGQEWLHFCSKDCRDGY